MNREIKKLNNRIIELEEANLRLRVKNKQLQFENEWIKSRASRMCVKTLNILITLGLKVDEIMRFYKKDESIERV